MPRRGSAIPSRPTGRLLLSIAFLAACQANPSPPAPTPAALPTPASSPAPAASPPTAIELPEPGTPHDADEILSAMRDSRRPGGVPDQLETPAVAAAVADEIWTFDGSRWNEVVAGGSCGPETCTLEIAGTPEGAHGEDLYIFSVVPGGEVRLVAAELRGLPASMVGPLDELAHGLVVDGTLDGLLLQSVRWRPPPDFGLFELSYRSGGEEGSCGVDLTIDVPGRRLVEDRVIDC